jgi:hypothetical protein
MAFGGYKLKWEKGRFSPSSTEPYSISRSKLDRFLECPRCFWLEARYGIGRPDTPPFTLNNAVDELFKREFDVYRAQGEPHPLMERYDINAIPFAHPDLEEWRDALKRGIRYLDSETNLELRGGIDDVWINEEQELHIVDYKATAGKSEVTLDDAWKIQYKRQVEVYQWLFRANGFTVSPIAYFVYANGQNDRPMFDGVLSFDVTILPYEGDDTWIPKTLQNIKACLVADTAPASGTSCEYCAYRTHAGKKLLELHQGKSS